MELLDEKIALLERQMRIQEGMDKEREERGQKAGEVAPILTIEKARAGIKAGSLTVGEKTYVFDRHSYFEGKLPWIHLRDFFDEEVNEGLYQKDEEDNQFILYSSLEASMELLLTYLHKGQEPKTLVEREKDINAVMIDMGLYMDICKKVELNKLDYLCGECRTGKGTVYNLTFWVHHKENRIVGNMGFMVRDPDIYKILLEAMVLEINELL